MLGQTVEGKMYTFDENLVSDLHKDATGYRPRSDFWEEWEVATADGKQTIWDRLISAFEAREAEEQRRQAISVGDFERGVRQYLALGASSRREALVRMLDPVLSDSDLMYGGEYACFAFNLPWTPFKAELDPIVAQIQQDRMQKEVDSKAA